MALVSNKNENSYSSGKYQLSFNTNNSLSLTYTGEAEATPEQYWADSTDPPLEHGITDDGGQLIIASGGMDETGDIIISDGITFKTSDVGEGYLRRLTLGSDGNLRVYSWSQNSSTWIIVWTALSQQCTIYGMCGPNALCVDKLNDSHICKCLPGFHAKNSNDTSLSLGCEPDFVLTNCTSTTVKNLTSYNFINLEFVHYKGHDLLQLSYKTLKECEIACRNNCNNY
jgi:hypothetical protein